MKENIQSIQTGLLVVIALTVIYGTFIKDNSTSPSQRERVTRDRTANRQSSVAAQPMNAPTPQPQQNQQQNPQQPPVTNTPLNAPTKIAFDKMEFDFGNINQDSENKMTFKFTNTGDKPLIIETATGSCGCTVPEFPKEPIAPGESSEIKVVYKPGKQKGLQNKMVTVIANTEPRDTKLQIKANVQEVK